MALGGIGESKAKVYMEKSDRRDVRATSPVRTRRRNRLSRSSISCTTRRNTPPSARSSRRARCWSALRAPARRCWPRPSRARRTCRSSPSPARTSWKCSSASARAACAICSSRQRKSPRPSSSSMRSTPSAAREIPNSAATTSASRHLTSCWPRSTASIQARAS